MRFRLLFSTVAICLLLFLAGAMPAQAQIQSLNERNSFWQTEPAINLPVTLCHVPPGNPDNAQTIEVAQAAVAEHLAHGDTLGECVGEGLPYPGMVGKTGRTICREASGTPIDCSGTGQDGEYQAGVSVDPSFTDNGDGTVTDNLTGLIWLKDAGCIAGNHWDLCLASVNPLADGSCGLTDGSVAGDWRMSNVKELQSLIDYGQYHPALPPGHPFSVASSRYWSSTTAPQYPCPAWRVNFLDGSTNFDCTLYQTAWVCLPHGLRSQGTGWCGFRGGRFRVT